MSLRRPPNNFFVLTNPDASLSLSQNNYSLKRVLKAFSNEMAPNPHHFFERENFPPIFRKGSVVFLGSSLSDSITMIKLLVYF
jgi:hypothetical protein